MEPGITIDKITVDKIYFNSKFTSMKSLFLLLILSVSIKGFSQEPIENTTIRNDVAVETVSNTDKDLSLELGSERMSLITRRQVNLLSSPGSSGVITGKLKKGVEVQQLDIMGNYYLICHNGRCGYVPKDEILKINILKHQRNIQKDSTPIIKTNKS